MVRLICEWCGKLLVGRQSKFCSRACRNRYSANNRSESTRKAMSESRKGKTFSEDHKLAISNSLIGHEVSDSTRRKMSESKKGELNPNYGKDAWNKGVPTPNNVRLKQSISTKATYENYVYNPDASQPEYRRKAIETYGYVCEMCGKDTGMLQVHHIDGNHENNDVTNLVVLCISCHLEAHYVGGKKSSDINEEFRSSLIESRSKGVN